MIREDNLAVSSRELCDTSGAYVFISYAHKDSPWVMPILRGMHDAGIRLWFDGGLEAGTEWQNGIADHLEHCTVFLCFVSENSIISENCKNEIAFASDNRKRTIEHCLYIYENELLEPKIDSGTRMYMIRHQKMYKDRHLTSNEFFRELLASSIFDKCKRPIADTSVTDVSSKADKKTEFDIPSIMPPLPEKEKEKPRKSSGKMNPLPIFFFFLINALLIVACAIYLPISFAGTDITNLGNAWGIVCAVAAVAIAFSVVLFTKIKKASSAERHPYFYAQIPLWAVSVAALLWMVYITRNCPFYHYIAIYVAFAMFFFGGWRYLHNTFGWKSEAPMWVAFLLGVVLVLYLPINNIVITEYLSAESFVNVLKNIGLVLMALLKWLGQLFLLVVGGGFWLPSFYENIFLGGAVLNLLLYVWFAFFVMSVPEQKSKKM